MKDKDASGFHVTRKCVAKLTGVILLGLAWAGVAVAQNEPAHAMSQDFETDGAAAAGIAEYWTPERMSSALPMTPPPPVPSAPTLDGQDVLSEPPALPPGGTSGFDPDDPADPADPSDAWMMNDGTDMMDGFSGDTAKAFARDASEPFAPASASYPSAHTTYEFQGRYLTFPRSPVGKLFFRLNDRNWVCSASSIGYRHVVTAGHCVSDGNGSWATNVMFCPSYDIAQGGPNPAVGCWTTNLVTTTTRWHNYGEPDADIGMAIYGSSGTVRNSYPGYVTGWFGYAWNWGLGQHEEMFGYPSADRPGNAHNEYADFNGGKIYVTSAEEAGYTANWGSYADSKFLGTTQTPGCSGGPWVFRYGRKYLNTWNGNWVNGVNSHMRCWDTDCLDLYMEISSPQFIAYTSDGNCTLPNCGVVDTIKWTFGQYP